LAMPVRSVSSPSDTATLTFSARLKWATTSMLMRINRSTVKPLLKPFALRARRWLLAELHQELLEVRQALQDMRQSRSTSLDDELARSIESALMTLLLDRPKRCSDRHGKSAPPSDSEH
jgi:hypothetical protein